MEELMDLARSRVFRTLTDEERYQFFLPAPQSTLPT